MCLLGVKSIELFESKLLINNARLMRIVSKIINIKLLEFLDKEVTLNNTLKKLLIINFE